MRWQVAEIMGYSHYAAKGYRILVPVVRNHGYDFVAEMKGEFIRVNVKVAGLKDRRYPNSWSISQASGFNKGFSPNKSPCDIFLIYLPSSARFIELPGDFLSSGNSKSKLIPKHLLLS